MRQYVTYYKRKRCRKISTSKAFLGCFAPPPPPIAHAIFVHNGLLYYTLVTAGTGGGGGGGRRREGGGGQTNGRDPHFRIIATGHNYIGLYHRTTYHAPALKQLNVISCPSIKW